MDTEVNEAMKTNEKMDKTAVTIVIVVVLIIVVGAAALLFRDDIEGWFHPGQVNVAGAWIDKAEMDKYDFHVLPRAGDSYCRKCKKYIEGIVRICPYCGQYID